MVVGEGGIGACVILINILSMPPKSMCTVPFPRSPFFTHQPRSVSRGRPVPSPPIHYDNKCHTHTHSSPHHNLQPWRWRASVAVMARIPSDGARTPRPNNNNNIAFFPKQVRVD